MKKRLISCILVLSFCLSLTACSGGGSYSDSTTSSINSNPELSYKSNSSFMADGFAEEAVMGMPSPMTMEEFNTEEYSAIEENGFNAVALTPLSTFGIDVDTASYTTFRSNIINSYGEVSYTLEELRHRNAIRIEEFINYFEYNFENNVDGNRFTVDYEFGDCSWNDDSKLLAMTLTAEDSDGVSNGRNFVFLIDTSGSMDSSDKALLVYDSFNLLLDSLEKDDIVSVVTYAGTVETLLSGEKVENKSKIQGAIREAFDLTVGRGGGTNGSGGIIEAYKIAKENFIEGGNNRVIIASDGDMNLGEYTSQDELIDLVEQYRDDNIFLTTLGYGHGNYSDSNMEGIANHGNGNYYYIDSKLEAERVLIGRLNQSTETVAKDVKIQVEFNPNFVSEYRLLGYENREMSAEDFSDDTKDGGETGAGQQVTVLYEVKLSDGDSSTSNLKYQEERELKDTDAVSSELCTISVRYKEPEKDSSVLEEFPIVSVESTGSDFDFVSGLAEFAMLLRDSDYKEDSSIKDAMSLIHDNINSNKYREELYNLSDAVRKIL